MKGKDIIGHIVRVEMPDMERVRDNCVREDTVRFRRASRPAVRRFVRLAAAAAAAVCLLVGSMLINPQSGNSFILKAYAIDVQTDGTAQQRELSISDHEINSSGAMVLYSFDDDEYFYWGLNLKCEGENIKSLEFSTDGDGMFAKTYFIIENGKIVYDKEFYDSEGRFTGGRWDSDVERLGRSFTLTTDDLTDDLLIGVGRPKQDGVPVSLQDLDLTIRVTAAFNDGTTQEETLFIS